MIENYHISIDSKKAKEFVAFLKTLDFVEVEKEAPTKKTATGAGRGKTVDQSAHLPFFGMCPDWNQNAEEIRKAGWSKRVDGW